MTDIRNCKFAYRCTQRWADFEPVPGTMRVRFCTRCQSAVHRADTQAEFDELAAQGKCVAVFDPPTRRFTLGKPDTGRGVD
jgi:hypothetical protein